MTRNTTTSTAMETFRMPIDTFGRGLQAKDIALYALLGAISAYEHETGEFIVSGVRRKELADLLGFSVSRVGRALSVLRSEGLISTTAMYGEDGSQLPMRYVLHTDATR